MEKTDQKNPIFKKWWFWVIIVVLIGAIGAGASENISKKEPVDSSVVTTSQVENTTQIETTTTTQSPKKIKKNYIKKCKTIDFKTLSRNPEKQKGKNFKITGEVIQVQESWGDTVDLRINMTKETYDYIDDVTWTDTIFATVELADDEDRILEDDIITIYGECEGKYSYETVMGNTVTLPKINVKYFKINK